MTRLGTPQELDALLAASQALSSLVAGSEFKMRMGSSGHNVERTAWLAHLATLRECARPFIDAEDGAAAHPLTDAVDAIARLGEQGRRWRSGSSVLIDADAYFERVADLIICVEDRVGQEHVARTERIDIAHAPPLTALVDRVANEGRRFDILRDGRCVARMLEPEDARAL